MKEKFPFYEPEDIELACDADLNKRWEKEQKPGDGLPPRDRITVAEAQLAWTRKLTLKDISPPSKN